MTMLGRAGALLSALLLAACLPHAAHAQLVTLPQVNNAGGNKVGSQGSVLIDSSGAEKGTVGNPLVVSGGGGGGGSSGVTQGSTTSGQSGDLVQCATTTAAPTYTTATTNPVSCDTAGNTRVLPAATESHLGEVGGNQATITNAQTVTASSAYASGNAVGGLITFTNAARVSGGSGLIQSVVAYTKSAQSSGLELWVFSANPSGSTCTDKTAFSVAAADFDKVVWVFSISTWYSGGTPSVGLSSDRAIPYALASGTSFYACVVTRSTPTYASTSDVSVAIRLIRN